jgi:hypothetical protein
MTGMVALSQIVYTSIVGILMLMAAVEWILWFASFLHGLVKVYQKAEHWSIRLLCFIVGTSFTVIRYVSSSLKSLCTQHDQHHMARELG